MENLNLNVNVENLSKGERKILMKLIKKASHKKVQPWRPKRGDTVWYINSYGNVNPIRWREWSEQKPMWEYGSVFETKKKAEFAAEKRKLITKLIHLSEESYSSDSDNPAAIVSVRNLSTGQLGYEIRSGAIVRSFPYKFDNEEDAKAALKEVGEKNYLKYLCGSEE